MIASLSGRPPPSVDEARARADEILDGPEFDLPEESLVDRVLGWIAERLADLLGNLFGSGQGTAVSWIVLGACVAVVVLVVVYVVRSMRSDPAVPSVIDAGEPVRSAADWRAEAERFEAAGSWKAALRARYRELIAELIHLSVLRDVPGRTVGEYRTELARRVPAASEDFDAASSLFEAAWYGDLPTGPGESSAFRADAARVLEGVHRAQGSDRTPLAEVGS